MKEIIFVTGNKGKQASAQKHFDENEIVVNCYDYEISEPDVNDIEFIAKAKVMQAYEKVAKPCISLDCGFYIPNYPNNPNFPGAFPKRELLEKIGINGLLENMKDIEDRECYFKECLAYYDGKDISFFYGLSHGTLSTSERGVDNAKKWSDLWYVFVPDNCDKTLAEMTDDERINRIDGHTNAILEFSNWYKNL
jgi:XTP/dITP diphosphohydrolase